MKEAKVFLIFVIFLVFLASSGIFGKGMSVILPSDYSSAVIDEGLSIYASNMTNDEWDDFSNEINSTLGYVVQIEALINKSLPQEKKQKIWEIVKKRKEKVMRERELRAVQQHQEFETSLTYQKKLYYNNLSYYFESLSEVQRAAFIRDINSRYSLNLTSSDLFLLLSNEGDASEIRSNISIELRLQIEDISEEAEEKPTMSIEEFIAREGEKVELLGTNVSFRLIRDSGKQSFEIHSGKVSARSDMNLSIDTSYGLEGNILRAKLSNDRNLALKIMPDRALQIALALRSGEECGECKVELKEEVIEGRNRAVYVIENNEMARLLFLFDRKIKVSSFVDAENGELIGVRRPWWSFLSRKLGTN